MARSLSHSQERPHAVIGAMTTQWVTRRVRKMLPVGLSGTTFVGF